jgi:hypothetical protein
MRTKTVNNIVVEYPDFLAFSFNPMKIRLKAGISTQAKTATFSVGIDYSGREDKRDFLSLKNEIDISYYVNLFFFEKEKTTFEQEYQTSVNVGVSIRCYNANNNIIMETYIDFLAIFGAINVSEVFNASKKITWFKNFPFTVSAYVPADTTFKTKSDNQPYQTRVSLYESKIYHLELLNYFQTAQKTAIMKFGGISSTFNFTFSETFAPVEEQIDLTIEIEINHCTDGVYLKWLDRHGFWQYFLFDKISETITVANSGDVVEQEYSAFGRDYNGFEKQNRTEAHELILQVPFCDKERYKMIASILGSPLVYMYVAEPNGYPLMNYAFLPVTVKNGNRNFSGSTLQDFDLTIQLPDNQVQKL